MTTIGSALSFHTAEAWFRRRFRGNPNFGSTLMREWYSAARSAVEIAADAVFLIDPQRIDVGIEPALGLRQMQADGGGLPAAREHLLDVVHMRPRLVLFGQLLQCHEGSCESLRDDPFVVAGNSFSRHRRTRR